MKRIFAVLAVVLGCGVWDEQAQADPIVGSIEFFGSAVPSGSSLGSPITLNFNDPWHTLAGTGIYASAGVPVGTPSTFNDFDFTGDGTLAALVAPAAPLWSFSFGGVDYSFDLLTLTNGHTDSGSMSFTGIGIAHATGFDDTFGSIAFQGSGTNFTFDISTSTTSSVPEAGVTYLLILGFGLAVGYTYTPKRRTA
jgi:hypothetical protein